MQIYKDIVRWYQMLKCQINTLRWICVLSVLITTVSASAQELSDSATVSLITCAPSNELYSAFGHSGVRVRDKEQNLDAVFNYGTFDFAQPNFYLNFCRGHMIYMVAVDPFEAFNANYIEEGRNMYEQVLNLNKEEKQKIFGFLLNNIKPEHCNYRYDFLFDNCSTRIRDLFEKQLDGKIKWDYSTFTAQKSFRDLINDYSENQLWSQFGMGLLIGLPVDRLTSPREQTFLPDYLARAFEHATISGRPLTGPLKPILIIHPVQKEASITDHLSPNIVFGSLLLLILIYSYVESRSQKHNYPLDMILFAFAGIFGMLIFALGTMTEHTTTIANMNMLWAWPTHIVVGFLPIMKRKPKWLSTYFLIAAIVSGAVVVGWKLMPQHFLLSHIFIAAIYAVRSYTLYSAIKSANAA